MLNIVHPDEIECRSMKIIEDEVPEPRPFVDEEWLVVRRMIHTSADFELLDLVRFSPDAISAGLQAMKQGCTIITDTEMARAGIPERRTLPLGCSVRCLMRDAKVAVQAKERGVTRAKMAVDMAVEKLKADIFVIGNAPTALLRLLEHVETGAIAPKLVVGMPVGFVNAAESKALLLQQSKVPYVTIQGRKGGSALAACVINALAGLALADNDLAKDACK